MKYVIYNKETKLYFKSLTSGHPACWTASINEGFMFRNGDSAKRFAKTGLKVLVKEGTLVYTQVPEEKKEKVEVSYTLEQADSLVETFVDVAQDFYSQVTSLVKFYSEELSKIDGAQEDLLHKIEFDNISGLQAVLLMKKLKEVRIKRREVKDKLAQLKICEVGVSMPKKFESLDNRTYVPRQLPELFN